MHGAQDGTWHPLCTIRHRHTPSDAARRSPEEKWTSRAVTAKIERTVPTDLWKGETEQERTVKTRKKVKAVSW